MAVSTSTGGITGHVGCAVFLTIPYTGSYIGGLNFELYLIGEDEVTAIRYVRDTVIYLICEVDRSTAASLNGSQRYNITGCVDGINSTLGYVYLSDCTFEPVS